MTISKYRKWQVITWLFYVIGQNEKRMKASPKLREGRRKKCGRHVHDARAHRVRWQRRHVEKSRGRLEPPRGRRWKSQRGRQRQENGHPVQRGHVPRCGAGTERLGEHTPAWKRQSSGGVFSPMFLFFPLCCRHSQPSSSRPTPSGTTVRNLD